jgi:UDP-N-acetyl-2-amino-2-deoxyglucuronate dehydrogenase
MNNKEELVRVGLVGSGSWAAVIADAVLRSRKTKLVTCFSRTPEKRAAFSRLYGCDQEKSYEELLGRRDVDGVFLITPNAVHAEQTELAARYGKHVFVDKPIANTLEDGQKMVAACRENGVVLMVGHNMRRSKGFRKIKEFLDRGAIGKPVMVEANFSHDVGFELTPEQWRWRGDDSGCPAGSLMTMGVHHADTLIHLFGPVKSVFAYFNRLYIPAPVEDVMATIFQFQSGILGYLGSNYCSPKVNYVHVYGTRANLLCTLDLPNIPFDEYLKVWPSADRYTRLTLSATDKEGREEIPLPVGDPILEEVDEFADCIRTGAGPETDGPSSLAALALIRASIESARTGRPVSPNGEGVSPS